MEPFSCWRNDRTWLNCGWFVRAELTRYLLELVPVPVVRRVRESMLPRMSSAATSLLVGLLVGCSVYGGDLVENDAQSVAQSGSGGAGAVLGSSGMQSGGKGGKLTGGSGAGTV